MGINKVLIIAGMHRSGTSLITQWLAKCGLHVGERVLGPLTGNEEGHFEDLDFVDIHREILRAENLPDTGLNGLPAAEVPSHTKQKLQGIIVRKNQVNTQWGWKDPRTCLFLRLYRELIPQANYLFIVRDHASSVNSLINRDYKQAERKYLARSWFAGFLWKTIRRKWRKKWLYKKFTEPYLKVWIAYNQQILMNIRDLPKSVYIMVDYTLLIKNDKLIFSHLHNAWKFSLSYFDFKKVFKGDLLSKPEDISIFIKNKSLLDEAIKLEQSLRKFSFVV